MSSQLIHDIAPLGSLVRYSHGTAKLPQRLKRKLAAWENVNGSGRLVRKVPACQRASYAPAASIASQGRLFRRRRHRHGAASDLCVTSAMQFDLVKSPAPGSVRVLSRPATMPNCCTSPPIILARRAG